MSEPLRYPELTEQMKMRGIGPTLAIFGPGAIIASVTIGSGETVFASRGGAIFGYSMLWCFIAGGLMKFIQVYSAARYITLTGEHPIERWKYLPGPQGWVVWLLAIVTILCFPLWLSGLPKMLGGLVVWILAFQGDTIWADERIWGTAFVLLAIIITMIQSYGVLERIQTYIVGLLLLSILTAAAAARPDWLAAFLGSITPKMPVYESWVGRDYPDIFGRSPWLEMGTYLGAVGGGSQDYFGYIGMLREKAWGLMGRVRQGGKDGIAIAKDASNFQLGRQWLRAPLIDTSVSFGCVILFTIAFAVLGAAVLRPEQIIPDGMELLSVQANFLTMLHPLLLYFYQLGVFTAFFGTILAAYELYLRTSYECLRPVSKRIAGMSVRQLRPWVVGYCGIGGIAIMWAGGNPVAIVTPAAIFGGVLTCGIWCLLMVWTDRKYLPAPLRMSRWLVFLNIIAGLFLTGWGIRSAVEYVTSISLG